jgi:biopolymer transport protein ExbD
MALIKKKKMSGAEIPSASMADIAFMLLIFFIVATTIDVDTGIGITLPELVDNPETVNVSKDRMAAILINDEGAVLLDGKPASVEEITRVLKERIRQKINLPKNKKLIVSVKTARKTSYDIYIQALDHVRIAFNEVRDEYGQDTYGKKYSELNQQQQDDVKEKVPIIISIAEPEKAS